MEKIESEISNQPCKCKECGWEGYEEELEFADDSFDLECPECGSRFIWFMI